MKKTKIQIVTTGGTIDKSYDETDGTLENRESRIRNHIIADLRLPYTELNFHTLFSKDSLDITTEDRVLLVNFISSLQPLNNPTIIIHGTDTMEQSAKLCEEKIPTPSAPIIFTGAMAPAGFRTSDALQNLTESFIAAKLAPPGNYICFHGKLHPAKSAYKDRRNGTFASGSNN